MRLALVFICALKLSGCVALNVLIYSPTYGKSHTLMNARVANTLAAAGHNVTALVPEYEEYPTFSPWKISRVLKVPRLVPTYGAYLKEYAKVVFDSSTSSFTERLALEDEFASYCKAVLLNRAKFDELRNVKFDIGFAEFLDLCGMGVLHYLGVHNRAWFSGTPLWDAVAYELGVPTLPSYVPVVEDAFLCDKMTFRERARNLYMWIRAIVVHYYGTNEVTALFREHIDKCFPNVRDIAAGSAVAFVNTDPLIDAARPLLHKVIHIGGLGLAKPKPLVAPFDSVIKRGKKCVVLFSLGTTTFISSFKDSLKKDIFKVFSEFSDHHFVVRIEEGGDNTTQQMAKHLHNVEFFEWIPQPDLLAHPRVCGMITHGGINGVIEAATNAVPVVLVPLFGDQFRNARIVHERKWGVAIEKKNFTYETLKSGLDSILNDKNYKAAAKRLSQLLANRPRKSDEELVRWTEFIGKFGPVHEFTPYGVELSLIAYFNLDVIAAAIVLLCVLLYFALIPFRLLFGSFSSKDDH